MNNSPVSAIAFNYNETHEHVFKLVEDLTDEQLLWRPGPASPSIGFHLWHMARFADHLQQLISWPGNQIWESEGVASRWGFNPEVLGPGETGMGMDDDESANLPLPGKEMLLDYATRAFASANELVAGLDGERFQALRKDENSTTWARATTIGAVVTGNLVHDNRHLGMIEALRGFMGLRGSATA